MKIESKHIIIVLLITLSVVLIAVGFLLRGEPKTPQQVEVDKIDSIFNAYQVKNDSILKAFDEELKKHLTRKDEIKIKYKTITNQPVISSDDSLLRSVIRLSE